jgi:hypothetical protein
LAATLDLIDDLSQICWIFKVLTPHFNFMGSSTRPSMTTELSLLDIKGIMQFPQNRSSKLIGQVGHPLILLG